MPPAERMKNRAWSSDTSRASAASAPRTISRSQVRTRSDDTLAWSQVSTVWECQRAAGRPGRLWRDHGRHGLELTDRLAQRDRAHRVDTVGQLAVVAVRPALVELGVEPPLPGRVGGDPDPRGQGGDAVLGRADPLATVVDGGAVGRGHG